MPLRIPLLASLLLAGCSALRREEPPAPLLSDVPPPAERAEFPGPPPEPGQLWIGGHWAPTELGWEWRGGEFVTPPRTGVLWVPGCWMEHEGRWVWTVGEWREERKTP